ncbi:hypothetical protein P7J53_02135 [Streptococcus suis]
MDYTDISILHTNDMHSYMENFPKKAQLIANIRDGNEKKGVPTYRQVSTLRCGALFQSGEDLLVNGRAVEPDRIYQIVTNSFVWSGKDNYDDFHKAEIVQDLGLDIDIISEFFKRQYGD